MKKQFTYLISAIIAVSLVFVSCSEDENGNNYNDNGYYNGYEPSICPPDCNDECCYESNGNGNDTIPAPQTLRINYSDWTPYEGARPDTIDFDVTGGQKFDINVNFNASEKTVGGNRHTVVVKTNPDAQLNVSNHTISNMATPHTNKQPDEYVFGWMSTPAIGYWSGTFFGDSIGTNQALQILMNQPNGNRPTFISTSAQSKVFHRTTCPTFVSTNASALDRSYYSIYFFERVARYLPESIEMIGQHFIVSDIELQQGENITAAANRMRARLGYLGFDIQPNPTSVAVLVTLLQPTAYIRR